MDAAAKARAEIARGHLRGAALLARIEAVPPLAREGWVNEALGLEGGVPDDEPLPRGAVPFLPAAVDEILTLARELRADDELVELGAGLGRVVILAHLLTGASGHGVEIQGSLVDAARRAAAALALARVTFTHADASKIELDGSVFFLYSPFNGEMLVRALERMRAVASRRPIRVCAVGGELPPVDWLTPRSAGASTMFYDSRRVRP